MFLLLVIVAFIIPLQSFPYFCKKNEQAIIEDSKLLLRYFLLMQIYIFLLHFSPL